MDFKLSDDQQMIREAAATFAQEQLNTPLHEIEEDYPSMALLREIGALGFLGMCLPEDYGGIGADTVSFALAVEEISKANSSMGSFLIVNNTLVGELLLRYGGDDDRQHWLEQLATGTSLSAFVSADSQSDGIQVYSDEGIGYRLNGQKKMVIGGGLADVFLVDAGVVTPKNNHMQRCLLLVSSNTDGLIIGPEHRTMGLRATSVTSVECLDCIVSDDHLLGQFGQGSAHVETVTGFVDIGVAAQALGLAEAAYAVALEYAGQRKQFGQAIGRFQSISYMLAEMQTAIETTRHSIYYAAWMRDQGQDHRIPAAQARLHAIGMVNQVTNTAVQIHGGAGYIREYPVEQYFRDARMLSVIGGTVDVQKDAIAQGFLDTTV